MELMKKQFVHLMDFGNSALPWFEFTEEDEVRNSKENEFQVLQWESVLKKYLLKENQDF